MHIKKPLRIIKGNNYHRIDPWPFFSIVSICHVKMNMTAKIDEIPSVALQDIEETKRNRRMYLDVLYEKLFLLAKNNIFDYQNIQIRIKKSAKKKCI